MAAIDALFADLFSVIPDDWKVIPFADAVDFQEGPGIMARDFRVTGVPLVRVTNLVNGRVSLDDCNFLDPNMVEAKWGHFRLHSGDLLVSSSGTLGRSAVVGDGQAGIIHYTGLIRMRPKGPHVDIGFIRYFLASPWFQQQARALSTGSVLQHYGPSHVREMAFILPPFPEQRAIARILGALDDKIELNRSMNATLEAIARALFQSWFVDFDPVRAKAEGRHPAGMDAATAALFPDAFEETQLGMVPRGWTIGAFSRPITLIGGGTPKTSVPKYWDGDIPWYSVVDAPRDSDMFVIDTEKKITQAGLDNSSARLLPSGTTIISARGTVGKCALVGVAMAMNQSCYGVRGSDGRGDYYTYFSLRNVVADLQRSSHGSVFDTITRDTFERISIVCPPVALTQHFDRCVHHLMSRALVNLQQSRTLAAIRDTLLPKLLSGEVRVREAEALVEAAI